MATAELMPTAQRNGAGVATIDTADRTIAAAQSAAVTEAQGQMILARQFPRNEADIFQKVTRACQRASFAEGAMYSFPRGGTQITGPSVKLAREAARHWGNLTHRLEIIRDDEKTRKIRAIAWDLETNTKVEAEDEFSKIVYRKSKGNIPADERELRELTNRRGAIIIRNCILQLLPPDLIDDMVLQVEETLRRDVKNDMEGSRKRLLKAFGELGIPAKELEEFAGVPVAQFTADTITELRTIYASIRDGNSKWAEHLGRETTPPKGKGKTKSLDEVAPQEQPAEQPPADDNKPSVCTEAQFEEIQAHRARLKWSPKQMDNFATTTVGCTLAGIDFDKAMLLIDGLEKVGADLLGEEK